MRIEKGRPGYVKSQQKIRTIRTVALFALVFVIFAAGLLLTGTRKNLLSILAAVCCIPAAMSCVGMCMMWMRHGVDTALPQAVGAHAAELTVLYELYVTTREHSLFLDAAAVRGSTVTAYTSEEKAAAHIPAIEAHLGTALSAVCPRPEVKILQDRDSFLEAAASVCAQVPELPETEAEIQEVLKALSL